jgi:threonine synthase
MMHLLGREGLGVEPASAVAAAGQAHGRRAGWIDDQEWVVAVLTSSGIKWPQQLSVVTQSATALEPALSALQAALYARGLDISGTPAKAL